MGRPFYITQSLVAWAISSAKVAEKIGIVHAAGLAHGPRLLGPRHFLLAGGSGQLADPGRGGAGEGRAEAQGAGAELPKVGGSSEEAAQRSAGPGVSGQLGGMLPGEVRTESPFCQR